MHKIVLILKSGNFTDREEQFYDSKKDALRWLNFYRRVNNFVDNSGNSLPIAYSYHLSFAY